MIALNLIGTNKNSGTKTFNLNFFKQIDLSSIDDDIIIYIPKSYINDTQIEFPKNIKFKIKSNLFENFFIRFMWMQLILPIDLKVNKVKVLFSSSNYSPFLLKFLNIKSVLFVHTVMPWEFLSLLPGNIIKKFFIKKMMEVSIYNSNLIIVPSIFAKKIILEKLNIYPEKIRVINLGADHISNTSQRDNFLENFDYKDKYILSVLSCVKYHNVINLLKAYKLFLESVKKNVKFVIVLTILDKKYFNEINSYIKDNFKHNQIILFPNLKIKYLNSLYKNSLLYLYSSYSETFGLTTLEAMHYNLPLIVSKTSALEEINGTIPNYFDPDNIHEIKSKLVKIFQEIDSKKIIKKDNEIKNQLKKYLWKNTFTKTFSLLKSIS